MFEWTYPELRVLVSDTSAWQTECNTNHATKETLPIKP